MLLLLGLLALVLLVITAVGPLCDSPQFPESTYRLWAIIIALVIVAAGAAVANMSLTKSWHAAPVIVLAAGMVATVVLEGTAAGSCLAATS